LEGALAGMADVCFDGAWDSDGALDGARNGAVYESLD